MLTPPSLRAASALRHLQLHPWDDMLDEHRPVATPEAWADWVPPLPMNEKDREAYISKSIQEITSASADLPTEFEDASCYSMYGKMLARLERACTVVDLRLPDRLCYGTVASNRLNANIVEIDKEKDEYLLVISRHFLPFCYQCGGFLANVMAAQLTRTTGQGGGFSTAPSPSADELCTLYYVVCDLTSGIRTSYDESGMLSEVNFDRSPGRPRIIPDGRVAAGVRSVVTDAMEYFMLGHELAHLAQDRLTEEEAEPMERIALLQNQQFLRFREEHMSDWFGHILATHALTEIYEKLPAQVWCAVTQLNGPIFLAFLQLIDRASHLVRTGTDLPERVPSFEEGSLEPEDIDSHPPIEIRKTYLLHRVDLCAPPEMQDVLPQILRIGEWILAYLEECWVSMRGDFLRSHSNVQRQIKEA